MFDAVYSHFLSYGPSDQQTVNALRGLYNGLLIPGTVAAFQKEGTGGFVLALSASSSDIPYVIDPRFPLFQQEIERRKKSHSYLARALGQPEDFGGESVNYTDELIGKIADAWARFNCHYRTETCGKFDKYAKRLGEKGVEVSGASGPAAVLAPYLVANDANCVEFEVSGKLFNATRDSVRGIDAAMRCERVVATDRANALGELLEAVNTDCGIWVSGLDEIRIARSDAFERIVEYGRAIKEASSRGQRLFALYGGFFAVLLAGVGLRGASHGIGYGEARNWRELPQSGPPPARFYLPVAHRYVSTELAFDLWRSKVARCECQTCNGDPPVLLEYHDLMKHSVCCRAKEIEEWVGANPIEAADRLDAEYTEFLHAVDSVEKETLPGPIRREVRRCVKHVPRWAEALRRIVSA